MLKTTYKQAIEQQELTGTTAQSALVFALYREGKIDEARLLCDDLLPESSGDDRTALIITRAIIERSQGNYALSLGILEACEAEDLLLKGALHNGLAIACRNLGQPDRALIEYVGAADYFLQAGETLNAARVQNNIANLLVDLARPDEALEYLERAEKVLTDSESLGELFDTKSRAHKAQTK